MLQVTLVIQADQVWQMHLWRIREKSIQFKLETDLLEAPALQHTWCACDPVYPLFLGFLGLVSLGKHWQEALGVNHKN